MEIQHFDELCAMHFGAVREERERAKRELEFLGMTQSTPQLLKFIEQTKSNYGAIYACNQLYELIIKKWNEFSLNNKKHIRNFLLTHLGKRGAVYDRNAKVYIYKILGAIVTLGWDDHPDNKSFPDLINQYFIKPTKPELMIIGLQVLAHVIDEVNMARKHISISKHCKLTRSFRDSSLRSVFSTAHFSFRQITQMTNGLPPQMIHDIARCSLELIHKVLCYDFEASFLFSANDRSTVKIPSTWIIFFQDSDLIDLLWKQFFMVDTPDLQILVGKILARCAGIQRSSFSSESEQEKYIQKYMVGIMQACRHPVEFLLKNREVYHEFGRILFRLSMTFNIPTISSAPAYREFIETIAHFTGQICQTMDYGHASLYYIISFWKHMLPLKSYLGMDDNILFLAPHINKVVNDFVLSRLAYAEMVFNNPNMENPLEDHTTIEQITTYARLCHCNLENTIQLFTMQFDRIYMQYTTMVENRQNDKTLELFEQQLTWLIYFFCPILGKQFVMKSSMHETSEKMDGELTARVLRLNSFMKNRFKLGPRHLVLERLEMAIISFFKSFSMIYLSQDNPRMFYEVMNHLIGLREKLAILAVIVAKIKANLNFWAESSTIIKETMELFSHLIVNSPSKSLCSRLPDIGTLLHNHSDESIFPFLRFSCNLRYRRAYFRSIAFMLFVYRKDEMEFLAFVEGVNKRIHHILAMPIPEFQDHLFQINGLLRDIRGISEACVSNTTYAYFFNWFIMKHAEKLMSKIIDHLHFDADMMHHTLNLIREIVEPRGYRMRFSHSSPNGIYLFKIVSNLLCKYTPILNSSKVTNEGIYKKRYRLISKMMKILSVTLSGKICNFGVFEVYNDPCLVNVLNAVVRLALSIPKDDMLTYPKITRNFFGLIEILFHHFIELTIKFDSDIFVQLVSSLEHGIALSIDSLSTDVCETIRSLTKYYLLERPKNTFYSQRIVEHLQHNPQLFDRILEALLRIVMFETAGAITSISAAILPLIVLNPEHYHGFVIETLNGIPNGARRVKMKEAFTKLMKDITLDLTQLNQTQFTKNLLHFKMVCTDVL